LYNCNDSGSRIISCVGHAGLSPATRVQAKLAIDHHRDSGKIDVPRQQLQRIAQSLALDFVLGPGKQTNHWRMLWMVVEL